MPVRGGCQCAVVGQCVVVCQRAGHAWACVSGPSPSLLLLLVEIFGGLVLQLLVVEQLVVLDCGLFFFGSDVRWDFCVAEFLLGDFVYEESVVDEGRVVLDRCVLEVDEVVDIDLQIAQVLLYVVDGEVEAQLIVKQLFLLLVKVLGIRIGQVLQDLLQVWLDLLQHLLELFDVFFLLGDQIVELLLDLLVVGRSLQNLLSQVVFILLLAALFFELRVHVLEVVDVLVEDVDVVVERVVLLL